MGSPWPRQAAAPPPSLASPSLHHPLGCALPSLGTHGPGHPPSAPLMCTGLGGGRRPLLCTSALTAAPGREAGAPSVVFTPRPAAGLGPLGPAVGHAVDTLVAPRGWQRHQPGHLPSLRLRLLFRGGPSNPALPCSLPAPVTPMSAQDAAASMLWTASTMAHVDDSRRSGNGPRPRWWQQC